MSGPGDARTGDGSLGDGADDVPGIGVGTGADADAAQLADGDADAACPMVTMADVPSVTAVNFVLTNASSVDRYVITAGQYCNAVAIDDFILSTQPWQQQCEGPMPQIMVTFTRVAPGATLALPWDGRRAMPYATHVDCSWASGPSCSPTERAALQPAASGSHLATFGVANAPPNCMQRPTCVPGTQAYGSLTRACDPGVAGVPTTFVMQAFTLPASGSVTVNVAIP